jgi:hypothetical protein
MADPPRETVTKVAGGEESKKYGRRSHRGIDVPGPESKKAADVSGFSSLFSKWADESRSPRQPQQTTQKPLPVRLGRHIVVFIDGTSNTPEELRHTRKHNLSYPPPITNVVRLMRGVVTDDTQTDFPQVIGYFRGVGTEGSRTTRLIDMAFGRGLSRIILDAYRFISHNLEWVDDYARLGQDKIFIFGLAVAHMPLERSVASYTASGFSKKRTYGSCHSTSNVTSSSSTQEMNLTLAQSAI